MPKKISRIFIAVVTETDGMGNVLNCYTMTGENAFENARIAVEQANKLRPNEWKNKQTHAGGAVTWEAPALQHSGIIILAWAEVIR